MQHQESMPIPDVTLTADDLAEMASKAAAYYEDARHQAADVYDHDAEDLAEHSAVTASRVARREQMIDLSTRHLRPEYTVATRLASFSDDRWPELWNRVSTHDIQRITMEGRSEATSFKVDLDLLTRRTDTFTNTVRITSTDDDEFDRLAGYFRGLFRLRRADLRTKVSTGALGLVMWFALPALAAGAAVGFVIDSVDPRPLTPFARAVLTLVLAAGALAIGGWYPMIAARDRIAPRVSIRGVGPYLRARENLVVIALSLVASLVVPVAFVVLPWLLGQDAP